MSSPPTPRRRPENNTLMTNPIRTALIYGSTRRPRFCDKVADWTARHLEHHDDFKVQRVDPAAVQRGENDATGSDTLKTRMTQADAFIIVHPEYNHGYPAPLKALIDDYTTEWQAKPVAFVSYGGISGGIHAAEQLRTVLGWLHAVPIRDGVILSNVWRELNADEQLTPGAPAEQAAELMLARLHWWASALRTARQAMPYEQAVA